MIKSDQHMHSSFSGDSKAQIPDIINSAIEKNLDTICLTDHFDPLFPCYRADEDNIFELDTVRYNEMAVKLRNNEEIQSKINVRVGVELGIYPKVYDMCKEIAAEYPYDFIILSSHTAGGMDPYWPEYWEDKDPIDGIKMYFEEILQNLQNYDDFDVYGHLDYCVRYTKTTPKQRSLKLYKEIIREIFRIIVDEGKGIEINSGGLRRKGFELFNPSTEILTFYKECGGKIITFGSDAHTPEDVAYGIKEAGDILKTIGFEYIADFKERKINFTRL
jgi:histidinol-phosphatase (PHP family)